MGRSEGRGGSGVCHCCHITVWPIPLPLLRSPSLCTCPGLRKVNRSQQALLDLHSNDFRPPVVMRFIPVVAVVMRFIGILWWLRCLCPPVLMIFIGNLWFQDSCVLKCEHENHACGVTSPCTSNHSHLLEVQMSVHLLPMRMCLADAPTPLCVWCMVHCRSSRVNGQFVAKVAMRDIGNDTTDVPMGACMVCGNVATVVLL